MKKYRKSFLLIIAIFIFHASCSPLSPSETPSPTLFSTHTPTATKTVTITPSPTSLPTATPLPVLSPLNADQIKVKATLGKGMLLYSAWSPNGNSLAVSTTSGIYFYDPKTFKEKGFLKTNYLALHIEYISDGTKLLAQNDSGGIIIYRISDGSQVTQFVGGANPVRAISPDGTMIAIGSNNEINLWRCSDGTLVKTIKGATSKITEIAFSPNGEILVAESENDYFYTWEVSSGALLKKTFVLYGASKIQFSPDGTTLALDQRNWLLLLRVTDMAYLKKINIKNGFSNFAYSPDGNILAFQNSDYGTITLWSLANNKLFSTMKSPPKSGCGYNTNDWCRAIYDMDFSPDGTVLTTINNENALNIWSVTDGTLLHTIEDFTFPTKNMSLSEDGTIINTITYNGIYNSWNISANNIVKSMYVSSNSIFTADGSELATCCGYDNTLRIISTSDGEVLNTIKNVLPDIRYSGVYYMKFARENSLLLVGSVTGIQYDLKFGLWDISSGKEIYKVNNGSPIISPNGDMLAITTIGRWMDLSSYGDMKLIRVPDETLLFSVPKVKDKAAYIIAFPEEFSPDGKILFYSVNRMFNVSNGVGTKSSNLYMLDIANNKVLNTPELSKYGGLSQSDSFNPFTPDGQAVIVGNQLFRVSDGTLLHPLKENPFSGFNEPTYWSFSPNGDLLTIGFDNGDIQILSVSDGTRVTTLSGHMDSITKLLFSPDGLSLFSSSMDGTIRIWSVEP